MRASLLLIVCLPFSLLGQSLKPLSAEFVNCVTNPNGVPVASHKQRTPVVESKTGSRAYGEVNAQSSKIGVCENRTVVYVADINGAFRPILQQNLETTGDGSVYDGNGVSYLSWSPSGKNLLVVLFQWTWGTDGGGNNKYFLIDIGDDSPKLISPERAIRKQFSQPCASLINFTRWLDDHRIELEVRPFIARNEEGEPDGTASCVKETTMFSFDIASNAVMPSSRR
jgi:hypothetical protein